MPGKRIGKFRDGITTKRRVGYFLICQGAVKHTKTIVVFAGYRSNVFDRYPA
jgi:hypothetical protein